MKYVMLFIFVCTSTISFAQNPIEKEGWELTFNDEFNSNQLDLSKWLDRYYWGGRSNNEGVTYYSSNHVQFTDSTLFLVADRTVNKENLPFSSGMVDSSISFKQQFGYFEIRSKNPSGIGFWPAFWLVTTEIWPPEIDIYEFYTKSPNKIYTATHWLDKKGTKKMQSKSYEIDNADEEFHTYAVEWTEKKIIWYYDNQKIRITRKGVKTMIYPMHIIINLEVSGVKDMDLNKVKVPNALEVDYVRAYKRKT